MKTETTRVQVKRMFEGMLYHCKDMTTFLSEHSDDPYFETEEGRKIMECMLGILTNHVNGILKFMTDNDIEKVSEKFNMEKLMREEMN